MGARYWLSKHCFVCVIGEKLVCWNTRDGRFYTLSSFEANSLLDLVYGWPRVIGVSDETVSSEDIAAELLRRGILVSKKSQGKNATPVSVPRGLSPLTEEYSNNRPSIVSRDLVDFVASWISTLLMRGSKIHTIIRCARYDANTANQEVHPGLLDPTEESTREMREIFGNFERLRPLLRRTPHQIFSEQLLLRKMLIRRGFQPLLVLGLSLSPLIQRSWLQFGSVIIDCAPQVAETYIPIAVLRG